jgi:DNA-directed RNA polymerase specialized sigma24 family protein
MPSEEDGSITCWIDHLKAGDPAAAQPLWERYFQRLVGLARVKLPPKLRAGGDSDEEDAALSAFQSFCQGAAQGRFPRLDDRHDLWQLLVTITARKAADQIERARALKRGGGRLLDEAALDGPDPERRIGGLDQLPSPDPTPEFAAMVAEQYQHLLDLLGDKTLRSIAVWKLEGDTSEEIAGKLGCSLRTVANKLTLIRLRWEEA